MKLVSLSTLSRLNLPVLPIYLFTAGCYLAPSLSVAKLFIMLIGGLFVLSLYKKNISEIMTDQALLICFLLFTVSSCLWGNLSSFGYAFKSSIFTLLFVLFILQYKNEIREKFNTIFLTIAIPAGLLCLILLTMHFSHHDFDLSVRIHKFYGPIIQTIKTASILSLAFIIIIWSIFFKNDWQRWLGVFLFIPILLTILLLKSRGATLSIGVGLATLYLAANKGQKNIIYSVGIAIALLALLVACAALFYLNFDARGVYDDVRVIIWRSSIRQVLSDNLLFGIGYSKDQGLLALDGVFYDHSHNLFVSLFRIGGLAGLILFCAYFISTIKHAFNRNTLSNEQALLLAWLAMSIATLFFNGTYPVYMGPEIFLLLWLPLTLLRISDWPPVSTTN